MVRPLRIEFDGAWYHVMNRGLGRRGAFSSDVQRTYFLSLLADTAERFNAEWHAYCLMTNHYHLLLRTPEGNLSRIMRHLNGVYTQYVNRGQGRDGPLFRGRYKAILVDADAYWLELSRYLHRNPLEAGTVRKLTDFRWSSFRSNVGEDPSPKWLTTAFILDAVGKRNRCARYAAFVAGDPGGTSLDYLGRAKRSPILGDDAFRDHVLRGPRPDIDRPQLRKARIVPTLEQVVTATALRFGVEEDAIRRKTRGRGSRGPARGVAMYLCQRVADMRLADIARHFGLAGYASAGSSIRSLKRALEEDADLEKRVERLTQDLTT
ncbi:MAG: transposase [Gammaproteobacteria bacterium]|jgi:REP element-mobilizing transposase RayT|nr:transposase [Gammaproteobacteria bacterium]